MMCGRLSWPSHSYRYFRRLSRSRQTQNNSPCHPRQADAKDRHLSEGASILLVKRFWRPICFAVTQFSSNKSKLSNIAPWCPPWRISNGDCYICVINLLSGINAIFNATFDWNLRFFVNVEPMKKPSCYIDNFPAGAAAVFRNLPVSAFWAPDLRSPQIEITDSESYLHISERNNIRIYNRKNQGSRL